MVFKANLNTIGYMLSFEGFIGAKNCPFYNYTRNKIILAAYKAYIEAFILVMD